uniref:ISXO2-like transposase domain-containing protein n=1 Tax=Octopus bimaculoides TaxID=37653 RepID=A0A0L8H221_OCTBM
MSINNISRQAAVQWYEFCREICTQILLKNKKKLGGPNHTIQVDESWKSKKDYLQLVPDQKAETLETVIIENVEASSTIFTDMWPSYNNLTRLGYTHGTVNHSFHFVNPMTGVCMNNVESYWA